MPLRQCDEIGERRNRLILADRNSHRNLADEGDGHKGIDIDIDGVGWLGVGQQRKYGSDRHVQCPAIRYCA